MTPTIPAKLKKNDTIGLLSVSGDIQEYQYIENAINYFQSCGFKTVVSKNITAKKNYLSGDDNIRADALNGFFADDSINAIVCARGGYGAIRLLDKIDYESIKKHPKIFCGYSDITALQLMIYKKANLVTYNAPMAYSDFGRGTTDFTKQSFWNVLKNGITKIKIEKPKVYQSGKVKSTLWGGNLSTIQSLCGQDFIPDKDFIFITEDINEPVYKIDKMFTQLFNINQFKNNIKGLVLGDFSGIDNEEYFIDFLSDVSSELNIPIIGGLKFGHEDDKLTFPIGTKVELDTDRATINFAIKE